MACTLSRCSGRSPQEPAVASCRVSGAPTIRMPASGSAQRILRMLWRQCQASWAISTFFLPKASLVPYSRITRSAAVAARSRGQPLRHLRFSCSSAPLMPRALKVRPEGLASSSSPIGPMRQHASGSMKLRGRATQWASSTCQPRCATAPDTGRSSCRPSPSRSTSRPVPQSQRAMSFRLMGRLSPFFGVRVSVPLPWATRPPRGKSPLPSRLLLVLQRSPL